jgi:hypothetical protein
MANEKLTQYIKQEEMRRTYTEIITSPFSPAQ